VKPYIYHFSDAQKFFYIVGCTKIPLSNTQCIK
jgi:hypothetical protein